jgi:hypothetical protein
MSGREPARGPARGTARVGHAARALSPEQRLAGIAALALLASMFLPWYEKTTVPARGAGFVTDTVSAFGVISFVEAAVFLVSAGVLALLFARAERRAFHLPGGDGTVIVAAGAWAALLIFYRVFDRPDVTGNAGTVGIQWGFFVAFIAAGALALAGRRLRAAQVPEPPLRQAEPRAERPPTDVTTPMPSDAAPARQARPTGGREAKTEQLSLEDPTVAGEDAAPTADLRFGGDDQR